MIFFLAFLALVSPEQIVHGPYTPSTNRHDRVAVAGDDRNVLVAFTAIDDSGAERVHIKKAGGAPLEMMLTTDNATGADMPSLAQIGDRYLLAWREEFVTPNQATPFTPRHRTLAVRLDANAQRIDLVPFNLHETLPIVDDTSNMFAIADGDVFRVFSAQGGTWESRISPAGGLLGPADVPVVQIAAGTAASNGRTTAFGTLSGSMTILPWPLPPAFFIVQTPEGRRFETFFTFHGDAVHAIATNGSGFLAVWREGRAIRAVRLDADASPLGAPFTIAAEVWRDASRTARVIAAWTGSQYLVAWEENNDVFGATVSTDGSVTSAFPIAASPADERLPAIHSLGDGRALIAYRTGTGSLTHIAVRTVSVPQARPRATRAR